MADSATYKAFKTIIFRKMDRLNQKNRGQGKTLLSGHGIDDPIQAVIIGCYDAMIFDSASALAFMNYARKSVRRKLIKEYLAQHK
jgi:hypothetical protein